MLDILSFIEEKGGNPELIRESQRRRHASVEVVDQVITLYDGWRRGMLFTLPLSLSLSQLEVGGWMLWI